MCSCIYPLEEVSELKNKIEVPEKQYKHKLETVTENEEVCSFAWDMQIHTHRELSVNRSDIGIKDYAK